MSATLGKRVRKVNTKFVDSFDVKKSEKEKKKHSSPKETNIDLSLPLKRERKKVKYEDYISPKQKKTSTPKKGQRASKKSKNDESQSPISKSPNTFNISKLTNIHNALLEEGDESPPHSPYSLQDDNDNDDSINDDSSFNTSNPEIESIEEHSDAVRKEIAALDAISESGDVSGANNPVIIKSQKKLLEEKLLALNQDLEIISSKLEKKVPRKLKKEEKEREREIDSEINNIFKAPDSSPDPSPETDSKHFSITLHSGGPANGNSLLSSISPPNTPGRLHKLPNTKPTKNPNKKILKNVVLPRIKKNKDEDDNGIPSGVELPPNMQVCLKILRSIMKHKFSFPFLEPVDPIKLNIPDYLTIITHPMDLGTIKEKLCDGKYASIHEFAKDMNLVFDNACTYNHESSDVFFMSETLQKIFNKKFAPISGREKPLDNTPSSPTTTTTTSTASSSPSLLPLSPNPNDPNNSIIMTRKKKLSLNQQLQHQQHHNQSHSPYIHHHHHHHHHHHQPHHSSLPSLTREEKRKLANRINKLSGHNLNIIVDIVKQSIPDIDKDTDEIAIDMEILDDLTLRDLEAFVAKIKRKNKAAKQRRFSQLSTTDAKNQNETKSELPPPSSSINDADISITSTSTSTSNTGNNINNQNENENVNLNVNDGNNGDDRELPSGNNENQLNNNVKGEDVKITVEDNTLMEVEENITNTTFETNQTISCDKTADLNVIDQQGDDNMQIEASESSNVVVEEKALPIDIIPNFSQLNDVPVVTNYFGVQNDNNSNINNVNIDNSNNNNNNNNNTTEKPDYNIPEGNTENNDNDDNEKNTHIDTNIQIDDSELKTSTDNIFTFVSQTHSDTESDSDSKKIPIDSEVISNNNNHPLDSFY